MNQHPSRPLRPRSRSAARVVLASFALFASLAQASSVRAEIFLNELVVRGTEQVEVFNSGPGGVDLTDWTIVGDLGTFQFPDGTLLPQGAYLVVGGLNGIFHDIGGEILVFDSVNDQHDRVQYGNKGGAPLGHDNPAVSMCRAPDAVANPPLDPVNDAIFWTLDFSATFGSQNDAPPSNLGSSVKINELGPTPLLVRANDVVELWNPSAVLMPLAGWVFTIGSGGEHFFTGGDFIPANGVAAFKLDPPMQLEDTELAYLFDSGLTRVDQLGFDGAALTLEGVACYARCPDGGGANGRSDGYDFETSGGGQTFFTAGCTLGASNSEAVECGGPSPVETTPWGRLKSMFR